MLKILLAILILYCNPAQTEPRLRPVQWATPIINTTVGNFYQIDRNLYRAAQPEAETLNDLSALGIKEILNLREYHSDNEAAKQNFIIHSVPMDAAAVTEAQLTAALIEIKNRQAPLLIHCWHGSDRTGATVAAYRLVFQNWTKAAALDEMINGGYGYHADFYPNLVELINQLDVAKIKQQLQISP
jgi:tyrosine-protein phosphatase SIW14